ncbi:MAG: tetratricopeptide repeat protein [Nitrospirae bacterium]|nr:tetratricopeptide repeat protein [Nitrospirota bacterium]
MTSILLYIASILSAILAMKTKENAFTLPVVIALYEFFFFKGSLGKRVLYLIPFLLTMLIIPITLIGIDKPVGEIISGLGDVTEGYGGISRWDYLFTEFRVITTYIRLLFLPINQNIGYDYPVYHSFFDIQVLLSFLLLLSIFGFAIYLYVRSMSSTVLKLIAFGIYWFFIALLVESSIIPIPMVINEYRVYLPSVGGFLAFIAGAFLFMERLKSKKIQTAILAFLILTPLVLSSATYLRNAVWGSEISLWKDVVRKSPKKAMAHYNLGIVYYEQGLIDKAIEQYQIAISLKPDYAEAYNNLGLVYYGKGLPDKAIEQYQIALRLKPDYAEAYNNLGMAYGVKGLIDKAIEQYQIAISLKPDYAEAYYNLGIIYIDRDLNKAHKEFKKALQINPDFHEARKFLDYLNKI